MNNIFFAHALRAGAACALIGSLAALLNACVTTEPVSPAAGKASPPVSCCRDLASLPAPQPLFHSQIVSLQPGAPHFDVGTGLAAFAHFQFAPQSIRMLEVFARPSSPRDGRTESGTFYFAAPSVVFFDKAGTAIPTPPASNPYLKAWDLRGGFVLAFHFIVPPTAERLLFTVDQRAAGKSASALASMPNIQYFAATPSGTLSMQSGGSGERQYVFTEYGEVILNAFGAPLNPEIPQRKPRGS